MSDSLRCYRCGHSLDALTLPLSRHDLCPSCAVPVHACKMCIYFDPRVARLCREDDAEEVTDKEKPNFCEWFVASADAFDPVRAGLAAQVRSELDALFGGDPAADGEPDELTSRAEDLFK